MSLPGKLARLTPREWLDLLTAQVTLLRCQAQLRWKPVGSLVRRGEVLPAEPCGQLDRARAIALAVARAAEHGVFRPRCLARAMTTRDLLDRNGIVGSTIRVGVQRENGKFLAHAWILWGTHVLGDDPSWVARFTEVDDLRVLGNA